MDRGTRVCAKVIATYKAAYVAAILANLSARVLPQHPETPGSAAVVVAALALALNLATGLWMLRMKRAAFLVEQALSFGRIVVSAVCLVLFLGGVLYYSPVFLVVWRPIFAHAGNWPGLLLLSAIPLGLEMGYFACLRLFLRLRFSS